MKVMPHAGQVHIEHIPAQTLAGIADNGRRIPNKCPAIQTEVGCASATGEHDVIMLAYVRPVDSAAGRDRDHLRIEEVIFDTYVLGIGRA